MFSANVRPARAPPPAARASPEHSRGQRQLDEPAADQQRERGEREQGRHDRGDDVVGAPLRGRRAARRRHRRDRQRAPLAAHSVSVTPPATYVSALAV